MLKWWKIILQRKFGANFMNIGSKYKKGVKVDTGYWIPKTVDLSKHVAMIL